MRDNDIHSKLSLNGRHSRRLSRRRALSLLGSGVATAVAAPWVLRYAAADQLMGPGGIPLARPDQPVTLPRFEDPIKSGLEPEKGGTFTVFNYADYIDKKVVDEFGKKYKVKTQITTFDSMARRANAAASTHGSAEPSPDSSSSTIWRPGSVTVAWPRRASSFSRVDLPPPEHPEITTKGFSAGIDIGAECSIFVR